MSDNCQECGRPIAPEHRAGPRRKLCQPCAVPAVYQRRWLASRPDYRPGRNAARRVTYQPRACRNCELAFTPKRSDSRYCCPPCGVHHRTYGALPSAEGRAAHEARYHAPEAAPPTRGGVNPSPASGVSPRASGSHTYDRAEPA